MYFACPKYENRRIRAPHVLAFIEAIKQFYNLQTSTNTGLFEPALFEGFN